MARFFLLTALVITTLFTMIVGLIRGQPYDDARVGDFLTFLSECSPPCWQGIQPGTTTTTDAVILLESHPWVGEVDEHIWFSTPGSSLFSWSWNGQQPSWIEGENPGVLITHLNRIQTIKILTSISLGDLWLSLPEARREVMIEQMAGTDGNYVVRYPTNGFEAHIPLLCPFHIFAFWQSNVELYFVAEADNVGSENNRPLICQDT